MTNRIKASLLSELNQLKSLLASIEASLSREKQSLETRAVSVVFSANRIKSLCLRLTESGDNLELLNGRE